ncbi:REP-associated tyrosine transposase [Pseudomonas sp. BIC9C]|uniref:REP-associated tyrosine transposase n=1 Tax=Pseudomonas sp. BIC9C TaxID=3078458 RepID=UPI002AD37E95|nr:transposase [Pseudomonas sp. BIC9C]
MPPHPNSHLLRRGRYSEPGRGYLVTAVVYQRRRIFADWRLGRLLVEEFRRAHDQKWVNSMAWVIMPDHFHWLIQLERYTLAQLMPAIKSRSTLTINRALNECGAFWQSGYHDRTIRDNEDLLPFAGYIVANPLHPLWDACWL